MIQIIGERGPAMPLNGPFWMRGMRPASEPDRAVELPEFHFSPREYRTTPPEPRYYLARGRPRPIEIVGVSAERSVHPRPARRKPADAGGADPTWVTRFTTKFSKQPDPEQPLVTPKGHVTPLAAFSDRVAELAWLVDTQHQELATTRQTMLANQISHVAFDHDPAAVEGARTRARATGEVPFAVVRLPDELVTDPETGDVVAVPRYAGVQYIAALQRRIEWEQFRSLCGPLTRTRFTDNDGVLGIVALKRGATKDERLALMRDHKHRWLAKHPDLPDVSIVELAEALKGTKVIDRMGDETREAYERDRAEEREHLPYKTDDDPGRVWFHTDEDPRPFRALYPFGDCRNCTFSEDPDEPPVHRGCKALGDALFAEFTERWKHRQTDVGYAGPHGSLGVTSLHRHNQFLDPEDALVQGDDFE